MKGAEEFRSFCFFIKTKEGYTIENFIYEGVFFKPIRALRKEEVG